MLFPPVDTVPDPDSAMKTRVVRIGNSRGIRIPKPLLEELGMTDEVELAVKDGVLMVTPLVDPRAGWAESIARHGPAKLLDEPEPTAFDQEDWSW